MKIRSKKNQPAENQPNEDSLSESPLPEDTAELSKKEAKKIAKEEKKLAKKQKKAQKAQQAKAKKPAAKPKAKAAGKPKEKKQKPPKPTKEEQAQSKKDRAIAKNQRKAEKIRSNGLRRVEKLRVKRERQAEKKLAKKEHRKVEKQFRKDLRTEIKTAKKDIPKSNLPKILIPLGLVLLLAATALFLGSRGIGPLKSVKLPNLPGIIKSVKLPGLPKLPSIGSGGAKGAENTVADMLSSFQALDFESAGKYTDMSAIAIPGPCLGTEYIEFISTKAIMDATFGKLDYSVASEATKITDDEYEVGAEVTALNFKHLMAPVVRGYMAYKLEIVKSGGELSQAAADEKMTELLSEYAEDADVGTVTSEINVKVHLVDKNTWEVVPDSDLIDAIFGGAIRASGDFFSPDPPLDVPDDAPADASADVPADSNTADKGPSSH
ncbi:MAG: hypothetical protein FWG53_10435 [Clostridiales bacterium]|nr:hypothetical protein [Clostridiales bacterium]